MTRPWFKEGLGPKETTTMATATMTPAGWYDVMTGDLCDLYAFCDWLADEGSQEESDALRLLPELATVLKAALDAHPHILLFHLTDRGEAALTTSGRRVPVPVPTELVSTVTCLVFATFFGLAGSPWAAASRWFVQATGFSSWAVDVASDLGRRVIFRAA
jgi:hypothetical protein